MAQNRTNASVQWAKPRVEIVTVTPRQAKQWLQANLKNRNMRVQIVEAIASDIKADRWVMNGESIKFATDGTLIDGQHRLAAIAMADKAVRLVKVTGLPVDAQDTIDVGAARTKADMLKLNGFAYYANAASIAELGIRWQRGDFKTVSSSFIGKVTHAEVLAWVTANPDCVEASALYWSWGCKTIPGKPAAVSFALWAIRRIDAEQCERFFRDLVELNLGGHGDPKAALLRRLNAIRDMGERTSAILQADYIFRAWNAVRDGRPFEKFSSKPNTPFAEPR